MPWAQKASIRRRGKILSAIYCSRVMVGCTEVVLRALVGGGVVLPTFGILRLVLFITLVRT